MIVYPAVSTLFLASLLVCTSPAFVLCLRESDVAAGAKADTCASSGTIRE